MEGNKKGFLHRILWIVHLMKQGLFWHGVRNNLARIGLDFMPYYWFKATKEMANPYNIKGEDLDLKFSVFGASEISTIKSTIIGIEHKNLLDDLKNGELCMGLKHFDEIVAYSFIRRKSFYFRKRFFSLGENDIYIHSTYVYDKYRGKNIAPYLKHQRFDLFEEKGVIYHHSITEYFNRSAIRMQKKSNAKATALYLSIILFKIWTMNFTLKKY